MPHAVASSSEIPEVQKYTEGIKNLLSRAREIRSTKSIEHALAREDFTDEFEVFDGLTITTPVEAAARDVFYDTLGSVSFDSAEFVDIWNLLDVCQIFSDEGLCECGLPFWLVEELFESLLVEQCRGVFDYLEMRREIMTARFMATKKLIILRSCNELLKRLSRAEDTAFSGRVFIYLFQSLDFGDRSAVNLRGAFHIENVTAYEEEAEAADSASNAMAIDSVVEMPNDSSGNVQQTPSGAETVTSVPAVVTPSQDQPPEHSTSLTALYPVFWSIQKYFCQPPLLYDPKNLATLKFALEATLAKFKEVQKESESSSSQTVAEEPHPALKRKWESDGDITDAFNPKYLTSPDLFKLEISDLAFRRHILVQGLILMDFLLYHTPRSKKKIESLGVKNKSVVQPFMLSEEDTSWATDMRSDIASYLQQGTEGKFYYRMVDTVLSRDKNWTYWKVDNCPSFAKEPVRPDEFLASRDGASGASASKKIRPNPMGSLDLGFLQERDAEDDFAKLEDQERYNLPATDAYRGGIMDDEMDIDMANSEEGKAKAMESKRSKTWRTLRLASRSQFRAFDKIEDGSNLDVLFSDETKSKEGEEKFVEDI